jgi:hypothetical protein
MLLRSGRGPDRDASGGDICGKRKQGRGAPAFLWSMYPGGNRAAGPTGGWPPSAPGGQRIGKRRGRILARVLLGRWLLSRRFTLPKIQMIISVSAMK